MKKLDHHSGIKKHLKRRKAKKSAPKERRLLSRKIIVQGVIIWLVLCTGVSALVVQHIHNKPTPITTSPTSSTDDNNCLSSNSGCPDSAKSSTPTPTTQPAQTTTPSTPATTTTPKPSSSSSTDDPQIDALNNQINFMTECTDDMSTAYDAYYAVLTSAENTYNTDLSNEDQQAESDYPAGSYTLSEVENNILNGEITKYNATVAPAYATYLSAMNTINSRGCNLTPVSESLY
jgi:cytoskeletal protein RodZ